MFNQVTRRFYAFSTGAIFCAGVFFLVGCSEETASKPAPAPASQQVTKAPIEKAPASPLSDPSTQSSSLEAHQQGTLGKSDSAGPLRDVYFEFDRYDLPAESRETLKSNATWLKTNPQATAEIEGHCDDRGTNEYNLALGAKRAESVKRYLIDLGIETGRLSTISYGEELPQCQEQTESCWAKNRRAHSVVKGAPTT
jgi:peptidoglycan-associated lipoprotein